MNVVAAFAAILVPYLASVIIAFSRWSWRSKAWFSVFILAFSFILSCLAFILEGPTMLTLHFAPSAGVYAQFRVDWLSGLFGILVTFLSLIIAIYSIEYIGEWGSTRYWLFYNFFVASMLLLIYANDLILLFIGWEGTGLASFMLISFYYDDKKEAWVGDEGRCVFGIPMWSTPTLSGLRALFFTRFGDTSTFLGIATIASFSGTTLYESIHQALHSIPVQLTPIFLLVFYLGALAKSAQFPFHEWLVTAMTGPAPVSALIHAATMVKAGVYFAQRFTPIIVESLKPNEYIGPFTLMLSLSLLTMFALASMALVSRELKLILAFSTASQLAYMLAAVYAGALAFHVEEGVAASLSHLMSHAFFKASLFLAAGAIIHRLHTRYITEMGGLAKYVRITFIAMLFAGLSLAGVPPLLGWWTKDSIVHILGLVSPLYATIALSTGMATAAYTARMIYYVFLAKPHPQHIDIREPPLLMLIPYTLLAMLTLLLGLLWPLLGILLYRIAHTHFTFDFLSLVFGAIAALLAITLTFLAYTSSRWIAANLSRLDKLYNFLYDRWYVNSLVHHVAIKPFSFLAKILRFADSVLDHTIHTLVPETTSGIGHAIRGLQSGDLRRYLFYFLAGVVATATFMALLVGG